METTQDEIQALGIDEDDNPIFEPIDEAFDYLVKAIKTYELRIKGDSDRASRSSEKKLRRIPTEAQPIEAGWTIFVNKDDPNKDAYKEIFTPLAIRRGMIKKGQPIENRWFEIENEVIEKRAWEDWLFMRYFHMSQEERPNYVLLLGDAKQIPLGFQIDLGVNAFVGRLAFDALDDYRVYVDKVLAIESEGVAPVTKKALFLGTEHAPLGGKPDATHYSNRYMMPAVIKSAKEQGAEIVKLLGEDATKKNFIEAISSHHPAVVFSASHGLGPGKRKSLDYMHRYNGSICFPATEETGSPADKRFSVEDVDRLPADQPLFWGSVFFQFACFGFGTPSRSDFSIWQDNYKYPLPEEEFISALPKRLLAHPKGPVAYIGHLDIALVKSIVTKPLMEADAGDNDFRLTPFRSSLEQMVLGRPPAYSIWDIREKYTATMNYQLNVLRRPQIMSTWGMEENKKYVDRWLYLTDSKNYLVLGDPAAQSSLLK